jgi:hypothetical protein
MALSIAREILPNGPIGVRWVINIETSKVAKIKN